MTRRLAIGLTILTALLLAGFTPWPAPQSWVSALVKQTADRDGLVLAFNEPPRVVLLPQPRLEAGSITATTDAGRLSATIARASGALRLTPLVRGKLELAELTVVAPRIAVSDPASWAGLGSGTLHALSARGVLGGLDRLVIVDGALRQGHDDAQALTGINAVMRRSSGRDSVDAAGGLRWRGEDVQLEASGFRPDDLAAGLGSELSLRLKSAFLTARFQGQTLGGAQAEGDLSMTSADLPSLSRWLGLSLPMPMGDSIALSGQARIAGPALALDDARVALDAGVFEGVASARLQGARVAIGGTLATDRLDLSQAVRSFALAHAATGWSTQAFELSALSQGDVDLRLSAGQIAIGKALLSNAALSFLSRPGRVDISLGAAEIFGGWIKGRVGIGTGEKGVDARLLSSFDHVDAASASVLFTGAERVTGSVAGSVSAEGSGENPAALMHTLDGKATLTLRQGEIRGVNLPELLRRLERRPLIAAADVRGGKTPFESASATARIVRGVAEVSEGVMTSPATRVDLSGSIGLAERVFRLKGRLERPEGSIGEAKPLPFGVTGTFENPVIAPESTRLGADLSSAATLSGAYERVEATPPEPFSQER